MKIINQGYTYILPLSLLPSSKKTEQPNINGYHSHWNYNRKTLYHGTNGAHCTYMWKWGCPFQRHDYLRCIPNALGNFSWNQLAKLCPKQIHCYYIYIYIYIYITYVLWMMRTNVYFWVKFQILVTKVSFANKGSKC